jgi:hypothetical protein
MLNMILQIKINVNEIKCCVTGRLVDAAQT